MADLVSEQVPRLRAIGRWLVRFEDVPDRIRISLPVLQPFRRQEVFGLSAEEAERGQDDRMAVRDCATLF
jgi:hypothetical protein